MAIFDTDVASAEKEAAAALSVMTELLHSAPSFGHERLKTTAAQTALEGMRIISRQGQQNIQMLLEALKSRESGPGLAHDAVYVLQKLASPSSIVQQWIRAAGGIAAAQEVLCVHTGPEKFISQTIWFVYSVEGLKGFVSLLQCNQENGKPGLPDTAVGAIVWAIFQLARDEQTEVDGELAPEAGDLIRILIQVMHLRRKSYNPEIIWSCCRALDALMYKDPRLGRLFLELGGGPLLLEVLHNVTARNAGIETDVEVARSCAYIVATVADGSSPHAEMLRRQGAMQALATLSIRGRGSIDEEVAVWALGHLGGLSAVLEAMAQASRLTNASAVLRGGVEAISDLSLKNEDVQGLPAVLTALLNILRQEGSPVDPAKGAGALSTAALGLSTHFAPGQLQELDAAVEALVHLIRAVPPPSVTYSNVAGTESAVYGLGRLALTSPAWQEGLKQCGLLDLLTMHIRNGSGGRRLVKFCFWAAASLAGMPFVVHELRQQLQNETQATVDMVDAAFCTIIDIMDDDLEHEYVLRGTERCSEASVPDILRLIAQAMQRHGEQPELQHRGCTTVALLVPVAPKEQVPPEAIHAILAAARRHPRNSSTVGQACRAVRSVLEQCCKDCLGKQNPHAALLSEHGTEGVAQSAIQDFGRAGDSELLEDASFVLVALLGIERGLKSIKDTQDSNVIAAGLKGVFELGRSRPWFLTGHMGTLAMSAGIAMAQAYPKDSALQRAAELLVGHCGAHGCSLHPQPH